MTDTRELLNRITAFRQRLDGSAAVIAAGPPAALAEPEGFRQSVRRLTGEDDGDPIPPQLTQRAHKLLGDAKTLLDVYAALGSPPLLAIGHRTEEPSCLVEQAVNAALGKSCDDAEALLRARLAEVTLADLFHGVRKRRTTRGAHRHAKARCGPGFQETSP